MAILSPIGIVATWAWIFGWEVTFQWAMFALCVWVCIAGIRYMVKHRKLHIVRLICSIICGVVVAVMITLQVMGAYFRLHVLAKQEKVSEKVLETVQSLPWTDEGFLKASSFWLDIRNIDGLQTGTAVYEMDKGVYENFSVHVKWNDYLYTDTTSPFEMCPQGFQYDYRVTGNYKPFHGSEFSRSYSFYVNGVQIEVDEYSPSEQRLFEEWLLAQAAEIAE